MLLPTWIRCLWWFLWCVLQLLTFTIPTTIIFCFDTKLWKFCSLILTCKFWVSHPRHQTSFWSCNDQGHWWLSYHTLYHYKIKCLLAGITLATIFFLEVVVDTTNALSTLSLNCVHKGISAWQNGDIHSHTKGAINLNLDIYIRKYQGQEACLDLLVYISATGIHGTCEKVYRWTFQCVTYTQLGATYIQGWCLLPVPPNLIMSLHV